MEPCGQVYPGSVATTIRQGPRTDAHIRFRKEQGRQLQTRTSLGAPPGIYRSQKHTLIENLHQNPYGYRPLTGSMTPKSKVRRLYAQALRVVGYAEAGRAKAPKALRR